MPTPCSNGCGTPPNHKRRQRSLSHAHLSRSLYDSFVSCVAGASTLHIGPVQTKLRWPRLAMRKSKVGSLILWTCAEWNCLVSACWITCGSWLMASSTFVQGLLQPTRSLNFHAISRVTCSTSPMLDEGMERAAATRTSATCSMCSCPC